MKSVILVSRDAELVADLAETCERRNIQLTIESDWRRAVERAPTANLLVADLLATLSSPHRISGYVAFAEAKMRSPACDVPLVLVGPPEGYRLDGMVGWPGFLSAFFDRPLTDDLYEAMLDYA